MRRPSLLLLVVLIAVGGLAAARLPASGGAGSSAHRGAGVVTIAAVGDIAMVANSDGGASYFSSVRRYLDGGVVLGNLEGTLTDRGASKCGASSSSCFAFRAPPSYAGLLREAGFDILNLANNHAYDFGSVGEADTVAALDRLHLRHAGRPGEIGIVRVRGLRVAVLGFAPYPWAQSLTNLPAARALVRRAASKADLVVVMIHAGAEGSSEQHVPSATEFYLGENRGNARAFAHAVVDAGADLLVGSGPHVLRGMEWYRGRLIAYSLGNFLGCHTLSTAGDLALSGVLHVTLNANGSWVRGDLVPIRLVGCGVPERDPAEASHGVVRELSRDDFGRRGMRVTRTGVLLPPA